jgi:integrase/recombinase XerD
MNLALTKTEFYQKLNHQNSPAYIYLKDERLFQDIWVIKETLPHLAQEAHRKARKTLNFQRITLTWLKELTKLTVLIATGNRHWKLTSVIKVLTAISQLNQWLLEQNYITETTFTQSIIQKWLKSSNQSSQRHGLFLLLNVLYKIDCISFTINYQKPSQNSEPKIITESIKYQLDCQLKTLEPTIYLAIKLLETLGLRSYELADIPLNCLRQREGVYQIRIASAKQNQSEKERDIPLELVPLIQQQQAKVKNDFGDTFSLLIPNWRLNSGYGIHGCQKFDFFAEPLQSVDKKINRLLQRMIEDNNIYNDQGKLAHITTHDFRRTYATIADRIGKSPDQIQHGLRHLNLDMQDSYIYVTPQEQEKRINRTLVNKNGEITTYKTDQDAEIIKREWKLRQVETGICTRPNIMEECEDEYVCLGCEYIQFSSEHLAKLLTFRQHNLEVLNRCIEQGQIDSRRANTVRQLLSILDKIITPLTTNITEKTEND